MECLKFMEDVFSIAFLLMLKLLIKFHISLQKIHVSCQKLMSSKTHVLLRLIKNSKKSRDNKNFVGTVLWDISKAFDCIPHDLHAGKLHAYGLSEDALTLVHKVARVVNLKLAITD